MLAFKDTDLEPLKFSEQDLTWDNNNINGNYLSLGAVSFSEEEINIAPTDQNLATTLDAYDVLNNPIWKLSMDKDYQVLISKQT